MVIDVGECIPQNFPVPSTGHGLSYPAAWSLHPALGLPRHYLIEPPRKESPLLECTYEGH